jgi:hypothetical protein
MRKESSRENAYFNNDWGGVLPADRTSSYFIRTYESGTRLVPPLKMKLIGRPKLKNNNFMRDDYSFDKRMNCFFLECRAGYSPSILDGSGKYHWQNFVYIYKVLPIIRTLIFSI